jgi:hypothetical protein
MTDQFQKVAKKRERPSKRPRNPDTGKFEDVDPLNDPDLLDQCVRWIRAAEELTPLLAVLARQQGQGEEERFTRVGAKYLGAFLLAFRGTLVDAISFDKRALREAKNPLVLTRRQAEMVDAMKRGDV